jgi:hypothetical protein
MSPEDTTGPPGVPQAGNGEVGVSDLGPSPGAYLTVVLVQTTDHLESQGRRALLLGRSAAALAGLLLAALLGAYGAGSSHVAAIFATVLGPVAGVGAGAYFLGGRKRVEKEKLSDVLTALRRPEDGPRGEEVQR